MNEMKQNWDDLRLFLAVARNGGLAAAAAATGKSPPTLGRRMLALEKALGLELFHRLPRGYELTEQGTAFFAEAAELEARVEPLISRHGAARQPLVKISAGAWTTRVLIERAPQLLGHDAAVRLRFIAADHDLDIARREAVIGIRNRRPERIGLACRRLGRIRFAGYALNPDITSWIRVIGTTPSALWLGENGGDGDRLEVTDPRNALDLALAGAGRALLPTFIGEAAKPLKRVTVPMEELDHEQWLVTHHEDRFEPAVRRVITRVTQALAQIYD